MGSVPARLTRRRQAGGSQVLWSRPPYLNPLPAGEGGLRDRIMRRSLRKIAENGVGNLGDTGTLADPRVVEDLVRDRPK